MNANEFTLKAIAVLKLECQDRHVKLSEKDLDDLAPMFVMGRENGYSPEEIAVILADEIKRERS